MTKRTQRSTKTPQETMQSHQHHLTGNTTKDHWSTTLNNGTNENDSRIGDADDGADNEAANHNGNYGHDNCDVHINKSTKSHVFIEQVRNCIEQGQLSRKDVRDEANVIIAAVSNCLEIWNLLQQVCFN